MAEKRVLEVQKANGAWAPIGTFSGEKMGVVMSAPSGGGIDYTDQFARDYRLGGELVVVDTIKSGTPAPFTYTLEMPFSPAQFMAKIFGSKNVRVRWYTGEYSIPTNYLKMIVLPDSRNGTESFSRGLVNDTTNEGDPQRRTLEQRAPTMVEINTVEPSRVASALTGEQVNAVISIGIPEESINDPGNLEYVAVTNDESTPATPKILYTDDGWETSKELSCTGLINNHLVGVARAGANLILVSTGTAAGIWYVPGSKVRDQAAAVAPTRATGVTSGTPVNCVIAVSAQKVFAGGNSGAVYKSTDGGLTWETLASGATGNVLSVAAYDENLLVFGMAGGESYKYKNGTFSALTVTGLSTSDVNAVAIPDRKRGDDIEIYLGASDGELYRSLDEGDTWDNPAFDSSGVGAIDGLAFAGYRGSVLYVIQTNGSTQSRILRDFSGGNMAQDIEILGSFTSPANASLSAIVAPDVNTAVAVGAVQTSFGMVMKVA